ncbi:MAG: glutamine--fructose-6-phosphate transaminase (isomerizing) [Oscillospiraceae bacterium]|jgi:glucosamine--fructose-6-phosphate aminotransferase (isomerizing)|nr:glutamine--fructose-6-phosphate transaminase (isomerizing) [Oscillospiraceae bacterium]
MCGIMGYTGVEEAAPVLMDGLEALEYRGYDSAGLAVCTEGGSIIHIRAAGRIMNLADKLIQAAHEEVPVTGSCGIAHTRWATHGAPTEENAHPHRSATGLYTIVHNGIIENYEALRDSLEAEGIEFESETDTEVIAQLLEKHDTGDVLETLRTVLPLLEGSYALGILYYNAPGKIYCARKSSPLLIAKTKDGAYLASDAAALLKYSREILRLEDGEVAELEGGKVSVYAADGTPVRKVPIAVASHISAADKSGYTHFMRKEIDEQPEAVRRTLASFPGQFTPQTQQLLKDVRRVVFLGCGSAYYAGLVGRYLVEEGAGIPASAELASEFKALNPAIDDRTLLIVISQSGETADTLSALRFAKQKRARTLGIVNVEGSTIAQECDAVIYTKAGLEVAVATTKAYATQLSIIYCLAAALQGDYILIRKGVPVGGIVKQSDIHRLPDLIGEVLRRSAQPMFEWARAIHRAEHCYFLGRNIDYAAALEGSLKLKEISYIHAEAYPAGELKHGTISLVEEGTPIISVCCRPEVTPKTRSNMEECAARGAALYCITNDNSITVKNKLLLPRCNPLLAVSLSTIPLQLLAYHCAEMRGCAIDKPRNLAKSVTVE